MHGAKGGKRAKEIERNISRESIAICYVFLILLFFFLGSRRRAVVDEQAGGVGGGRSAGGGREAFIVYIVAYSL